MVKITDGVNTILVPNSAYETQYKPFGWKPIDVKEKASPKNCPVGSRLPVGDVSGSSNNESAYIAQNEPNLVAEKPISEMNSEELRAKAKQLGVDLTGMTSKKQVRAAISKAING